MVHVYVGAAAGVIGPLQGLPSRTNSTRVCRHDNSPPVVGVLRVCWFDDTGTTKVSSLESGSIGAGARFDMETFGRRPRTGVVNAQVYVVRSSLESVHRASCLASLPAEAVFRTLFQSTRRGSCLAGSPAAAIVRGRVQPAHRWSCLASFPGEAIIRAAI